MQKTFFSLAGLLPVIIGFTQNVGIGTAIPVVNLHVAANSSPGQLDGSILITNELSGHTIFDGLRIRMNSSTASIQNNENGDLHLQTNHGATGAYGSPAIWIKPSGAIGIGTSTPTAQLEIAGQIKMTGGSPGAGKVLTSDATGLASWASPVVPASLWTANGNHIYNNNSRYVGVGTNTPGHSLHVHHSGEGGIFDASIQLTNNWSGNTANDGLRIRIFNESTVSLSNRENGDFFLNTNLGVTGSLGSPLIMIKPSGAIGLGTPNPDGKVEILGLGTTILNLNDGFLKVSGTNKTAFTVNGTAENTSTYILTLNYANQSANDILLVTHNYNPGGVGGSYHNIPVGVYWTGSAWAIYSEDQITPMLGKSFNVLVVKQ
jgi:hypothetical protein